MPQRYIKVPDPVVLIDPDGKVIDQPPVSLQIIISKLMHNPMWTETYQNIRAADAINRAVDKAKGVIVLAEDDWKKLESAVQNPKTMLIVGQGQAQVSLGLGFHPVIVTQILPLLDAIVNASTQPPAETAVSPNGKAQAAG